MTIAAKEWAEMDRISTAFRDAVQGLGSYRPIDIIGGCLGTIVVMADKLGQSPERALSSLLLAVCNDDMSRAREAIRATAAERAITIGAPPPAALPTIEQIKARLLDALPDYRRRGYEPSHSDMITDISAEVAKMLEEARR
jgi:hypothetical protein